MQRPDLDTVAYSRAADLMQVAAVRALQSLDYESAVFSCERLLAFAPAHTVGVYLLARSLYLQGNFKASLDTLHETATAVEIHPPSSYLRAVCCLQLAILPEAEKALSALAAIHTASTRCKSELLSTESITSLPSDALESIKSTPSAPYTANGRCTSVSVTPLLSPSDLASMGLVIDWACVFCKLGIVQRRMGRDKEATESFNLSLDLDPFNWTSFKALCDLGNPPSTVDVYDSSRFAVYFNSDPQKRNALSSDTNAPESARLDSNRDTDLSQKQRTTRMSTRSIHRNDVSHSATGRRVASRTDSGVISGGQHILKTGNMAAIPVSRKRTRDGQPATATYSLSQPTQPSQALSLSQKSTEAALTNKATAITFGNRNRHPRESYGSFQLPSHQSSQLRKPPAGSSENVTSDYIHTLAVEIIADVFKDISSAYSSLATFNIPCALQWFKMIPPLQRNTAHVQAMIGRAHFEAAEYVLASQAFERARRLQPGRLDGMDIYGTCLWHLKKVVELSYLGKELELENRLAPQTWCVIGNYFSLNHEHDQAIHAFKRAIKVDPDFVNAYTLIGHEYLTNEDLDNAAVYFRTASRLNPRHYSALYGLACLAFKQEKYNIAEFYNNHALKISPNNLALLEFAATIVSKDKLRLSTALSLYNHCAKLAPHQVSVQISKSTILTQLGRFEDALKVLTMVLETKRDSNVYFKMGEIYDKMGDPHRALLYLSMAHDGKSRKGSKDIQEAMRAIQEKLRPDPDLGSGHMVLPLE